MEGPGYPQGQNLPHLLHLRQSKVGTKTYFLFDFNIEIIQGAAVSESFTRECSMTSEFVRRLGLYTELEGHNGCVNCIQVGYCL